MDSMVKSNEGILSALIEISHSLRESKEPRYSMETNFVPDAMTLLSLPGSLRKTMLALYKLGEATAEDISKETERLRAVESACANQLTRMGYLKKKREGRKVFFHIKQSSGVSVE